MARLFFQYMAFTTMKVYSFDKIFAKVGFKFCQILNKSLKDCQRVLKFCQCCEIKLASAQAAFESHLSTRLEVESSKPTEC